MTNEPIKIGFFGTPDYAVTVLDELAKKGHEIAFVVTMPDRPKGRKLTLTPPPAKVWAEKHGVPIIQPETLKGNLNIAQELKSYSCDVFVVIAYGNIIPDEILHIPPHKSLNIHGSLLPRLRGSSPIETAILNDEHETGVTIMRMDKEMDHGPIIASEKVICDPWPPTAEELGNKIVMAGARLLANILPDWIAGKLPETEQNHSLATLTKKIKREDGEIDLSADPYKNFLKIQAYHEWPGTFFFVEHSGKKVRVKVVAASYKNGTLTIEKVIPEGGREMAYTDFLKGVKS